MLLMKRKTIIKIVIALIVVLALVGAGVAVYLHYNGGPIVGRIQTGKYYHLESIVKTDRFAGATMSNASYFRVNSDGTTGVFYLEGLTATSDSIPFIITKYQEGTKETTFEIEYLINNGEDTRIQTLTAISTDNKIRLQAIKSHSVRVIQQKNENIDHLDYPVDVLVFTLNEEA